MEYGWREYAFDSSVAIGLPGGRVLPWLVAPDLMPAWIIGLVAVTPLNAAPGAVGGQTRLDFGSGHGKPGTFHGEILELTDALLVRRYRPGFDPDGYERTVRYDLRPDGPGSTLTCSVHTRLLAAQSLSFASATRNGLKHLSRSLDKLRLAAEGTRVPLPTRIGDSGLLPQAL